MRLEQTRTTNLLILFCKRKRFLELVRAMLAMWEFLVWSTRFTNLAYLAIPFGMDPTQLCRLAHQLEDEDCSTLHEALLDLAPDESCWHRVRPAAWALMPRLLPTQEALQASLFFSKLLQTTLLVEVQTLDMQSAIA